MGVAPEETEIIGLMAAILGWQVEHAPVEAVLAEAALGKAALGKAALGHQSGGCLAVPAEGTGGGVHWLAGAAMADAHDCMEAMAAREAAAPEVVTAARLPRLVMRPGPGVIRVDADREGLAAQLARLGLDRLVLPLSLSALEDLLACAA